MKVALIYPALGFLALAIWFVPTYPFFLEDAVFVSGDADKFSLAQILFWYGHVPRGAVAILAGSILGLSGALLQTVLRNPIADPSTLGITAGAQLGLIAALVLFPDLLSWGRWPVAFAGSALTLLFVMGIGIVRNFEPVTMVISGMLVGLFTASIATAITLSQGHYLFSQIIWTGGSLVQTSWNTSIQLTFVLALGLALSALIIRPLNALSLDTSVAHSLGINVTLLRALTLLLATIMAASVSSAVGIVGFIGLAAPAFARALGARTTFQLVFLSTFIGALLLSVCDSLVLIAAGNEREMFPTGALTGLMGAPLLLWLLPKIKTTSPPVEEEIQPRLNDTLPTIFLLCIVAIVLLIYFVMIGKGFQGWTILGFEDLDRFGYQRFIRTAGAAAAGSLLALAGVLLQRLTANPLASPEVMGISGGAAIGYAAILFLFVAPSPALLSTGAAVGGMTALIILAAFLLTKNPQPERVLLAGIAISAFAAALLSVLMSIGDIRSFAVLSWLSGSSLILTGTGVLTMTIILISLLSIGLLLKNWLSILPFGNEVARSLGIRLWVAWLFIIVIAGLATGVATTTVGPLSFVGLMAPHFARKIGFADPNSQVLGSVLLGGIIMMTADFGARTATFPYELPLGLFASLIGAPWLFWLLLKRR